MASAENLSIIGATTSEQETRRQIDVQASEWLFIFYELFTKGKLIGCLLNVISRCFNVKITDNEKAAFPFCYFAEPWKSFADLEQTKLNPVNTRGDQCASLDLRYCRKPFGSWPWEQEVSRKSWNCSVFGCLQSCQLLIWSKNKTGMISFLWKFCLNKNLVVAEKRYSGAKMGPSQNQMPETKIWATAEHRGAWSHSVTRLLKIQNIASGTLLNCHWIDFCWHGAGIGSFFCFVLIKKTHACAQAGQIIFDREGKHLDGSPGSIPSWKSNPGSFKSKVKNSSCPFKSPLVHQCFMHSLRIHISVTIIGGGIPEQHFSPQVPSEVNSVSWKMVVYCLTARRKKWKFGHKGQGPLGVTSVGVTSQRGMTFPQGGGQHLVWWWGMTSRGC